MNILIPILTMTILGFIFSFGLVFAYKKLKVEEDPRIEKVSELLPQANCGACGYSGCRAFAEAIVQGKAEPNGCPVGGEETVNQIASFLGMKAQQILRKVARIHCRGSHKAAADRGIYYGISTCLAATLIGGHKKCSYGCLGFGDCIRACPFDAIKMGNNGLPVVNEKLCTACGKCVDACPRNIIELLPVDQNIMVFCRSLDRGPWARKVCKNACIACGICARACPEAIVMDNNLAVITDYKKITEKDIPAIEKCPTDAIGLINKNKESINKYE